MWPGIEPPTSHMPGEGSTTTIPILTFDVPTGPSLSSSGCIHDSAGQKTFWKAWRAIVTESVAEV